MLQPKWTECELKMSQKQVKVIHCRAYITIPKVHEGICVYYGKQIVYTMDYNSTQWDGVGKLVS